ncbi:glycosyl hydrolase family 28-related protein [Priestia megaterium]|uniref:glycosyl hydrolase family 28-related protein n=1 Tax=Priestia megaterium TaxID=1404 RepID=UPI003CC5481A
MSDLIARGLAKSTATQLAQKANWINVKAYDAKGDGITNDAASFTNALNACSDFGTLYVPNGVYLLNNFTITNKSITIQCESEKVIFIGSGTSSIRFISDWTDIQSVSTIVNTGIDAVITCTDSSKYAVGDIVKIVSEDVLLGYEGTTYATDYGGNLRSAEYKTVIATNTSNNTITVGGLLRYPYTNTVRVGKQGKHTLKLLSGTLGYLSSTYGIWVTGGMNHEINVSTSDYAEHTSIELEGTYGLRCKANIGKKSNESSGILDRNSSHFTITYTSKNCRHPFTTGHVRYSTQTMFYCYGVSEYGVIENCTVDGTVQAAFDSHEQSYGIIYRNSRAINNSQYVGIQVRGKNNVYENMHVQGFNGIQVIQGDRTDIGKVTFNGCIIEGSSFVLTKYNAEFNNCTFICKSYSSNFFITDSTVEFNNCKFYGMNTNTSNNMFRFSGNNMIRFTNCNVLYGTYDSNCKLFLLYSGTSDIVINNFTVRSEVAASTFKGLRFQTDVYGDGSKLTVNNIYLDTMNGLSYYAGSDDFGTFTAGLVKTTYPNFTFTLKKM